MTDTLLYIEHLFMYLNVIPKTTHGPHCVLCQERQVYSFGDTPRFPCTHDLKNFNYKLILSYSENISRYEAGWSHYFQQQFQFQKHILTNELYTSVKKIPKNTRLLLFHLQLPKLYKNSASLLCSNLRVQLSCSVFVVVETVTETITKTQLTDMFKNIKFQTNVIFIIATKKKTHLMKRIVQLLQVTNNRLSIRKILDCLDNVFVITEKKTDFRRCFFCL